MNQLNLAQMNDVFMEIEDLLTSNRKFDSIKENKPNILDFDLTDKTKRILVIEDDATFEPIWDHIISKVSREIEFYWASSPIQAQELIHRGKIEGWNFDLIISDIYLSSTITGIDLWNRYGKNDNFLLISSIDNYKLIEQAKQKGKVAPPYLQKPLDTNECTKVISSLINMES